MILDDIDTIILHGDKMSNYDMLITIFQFSFYLWQANEHLNQYFQGFEESYAQRLARYES